MGGVSNKLKKLMIVLISVTGLLMLFGVGLLAYLKTAPAHKTLETWINQRIPGRLAWELEHLSYLEGRLRIRNVSVVDPEGTTIVEMDAAELRIGWPNLFQDPIKVESVSLERPRVRLVTTRDGGLNIAAAFSEGMESDTPADEDAALRLAVASLTLTDGEATYQEPESDTEISAAGVALTVENFELAALPEKLAAETALSVENLDIRMGSSRITALPLTVSATLKNGDLTPVAVSVQGDGWRADASGAVASLLEAPSLSLELNAEAELEKIQEMIPMPVSVNGPLRLAASFSGRADNPDLKLSLEYGSGRVMAYGIDRLRCDLTMTDRQATLSSFELDTDMGSACLAASGDFRSAFPDGFLSSVPDLSLITYEATLTQVASDLARLPIPVQGLSGTVHATGEVNGRGVSPDRMAVDADVVVTGKDLALADVFSPVPVKLEATARYDGSRVAASRLVLATDGVRIEGDGAYDLSNTSVEAALTLESPDMSPILIALDVPDISGGLSGTIHAKGPADRPAAVFDLHAKDMIVREVALGAADLAGELTASGELRIDAFTLQREKSVLRAAGDVALFQEGYTVDPRLPWHLKANLTETRLDAFLDRFGVAGVVNGTVRLDGSLEFPRISADLSGRSLAYGDIAVGDLETALRFQNGTLFVDALALQNQTSRAMASGSMRVAETGFAFIDDPVADLTVKASPIRLADFLPNASGQADLDVRLTGPISSLSATATLIGRDLAFGSHSLGDLSADLSYAKGRLTLASMSLQGAESRLSAEGSVQLLRPGALAPAKNPAFALRIPNAVVALSEIAPNLSGELALDCDIAGTLSDPRGAVRLSGGEMDLAGQKLSGIDANIRLADGRVNIASLKAMMHGDQNAEIRGWIDPFENTYDLSATTTGIDLNRLAGVQVSPGKVRFDLSGAGPFDRPELRGTLTVEGLEVRKTAVPPIQLALTLSGDILSVTGDFPAVMTAEADLARRTFAADLKFDRTDLAPYFTLADLPELGGVMTGAVQLDGSFDAPESTTALAQVSRLEIDMDGRDLVRSDAFSLDYQNRRLSVPELRLRLLEDGDLRVSGTADPEGRLDLTAKGRIPLPVFREFHDALRTLEGDLSLDFQVQGDFQNPEIQGVAILTNAGMTLSQVSHRVRDLNAEIRLDKDTVIVERLDAAMGDGKLHLDGRLGLDQWRPASGMFQLDATRLPIALPDKADAVLDAKLSLNGTLERSKISGEITIVEGRYHEDFDLSLTAIARKPRQRATDPASETTPSWLAAMEMDVALKARNPILIENNLALAALKPALRIKGTPAKPVVSGRAAVDPGGTVTYQETEFEIQKGIVDFLNPYTIEPTFDIRARTDIRKWTVYLAVTGTPDNLKFVLTSDPPETQGDLLSLLAVGKTSAELASGQGGSKLSATQMLADIVTEKLAGGVKDATGLDIVEVKYTEGESAEDESDVAVTVGKELSRRLTVKYGVESRDGGMVQKATTEYKILENLIMSAFQDTDGVIGGGLMFRLEFR